MPEQRDTNIARAKGRYSERDMALPPGREVPNSVTHIENDNADAVTKEPNEPTSTYASCQKMPWM